MKMFNKLKHVFNVSLRRNFCSALYITSDKAQKTFAVLTPVIDFEKQFKNKDVLQKNFQARGLPLDVEKIEERWNFYHYINIQKKTLEATRIEIGSWIKELMKDEEKNKDDIEKCKLHSKLIKNDILNVKTYFYSLEEDTMLLLLSLPNVLHERTPLEPEIFHQFLESVQEKSPPHLDIAEKYGLVEYVDSFTCFLKSEAALFEIAIYNYFKRSLLDFNYTQFSNSNFCRSVIVEGCGINYKDKSKVFVMEQPDNSKDEVNRLHLCGSASLYPFMAYFCRHSVPQTQFPLTYFSLGKKYQPVGDKNTKNLFNLSQESVVNIFTVTLEEEDILADLIKLLTALYEPLGYHFRLVYVPAKDLDKSESLRISIQMYSNYIGEYVEVGNISAYDNYLSKRLLFCYNANNDRKYPKIIAGEIVNVAKLLGCVLENNSVANSDLISPFLKKYMFV